MFLHDTCGFSLLFFNTRVCYAIHVIVLVCIEMFVCRYFVCWVEFDELYNICPFFLCSCIILCYFTGIFYAVVRQISMLFTDNKDSLFCMCPRYKKKSSLAKALDY